MAAKKKKKATRKKAARKTATDHAREAEDKEVTDEEREFKAAIKDKIKADRESFLDGYKAAKIEAFLTCVGDDYDKTTEFVVHPSCSRIIAPILEEYLDKHKLRVRHQRPTGYWAVATDYTDSDEYMVRFKDTHSKIAALMAQVVAAAE